MIGAGMSTDPLEPAENAAPKPLKKKPSGTRELLDYVAPNLYRHSVNQTYYGIKKVNGISKPKALGPEGNPTKDRKTADRFLREWLDDLANSDTASGDLTLEGLLERFQAVRAGKEEKTRDTEASLIKAFKAKFPRPMTTMVTRVKTSDLQEWLGKLKKKSGEKLRNSSYNRARQFLSQLFDVAVHDRILTKRNNPYDPEAIPRKKDQEVERPIPEADQFERLIEEIRNPKWEQVKGKRGGQRPMSFPDSANFVEFIGRAGVGEAEASRLEWTDVGEKKIKFTRKKTGAVFYVTIFAGLRPLIDRLRAEAIAEAVKNNQPPIAAGLVFKVKDAGKAIQNAAQRLGLRHFTPRNFRSMHIVRLLENNVDVKFVAQEQGHKDGGKLILGTYSEVKRDQHSKWEEEQVARAEGRIVEMPRQSAG